MTPKFNIGQEVYYVDRTMSIYCHKDDVKREGYAIFSIIASEISFPNFNMSSEGTLGWISYMIDGKNILQENVFENYDSALLRVEQFIKSAANKTAAD